MLKFEWREIFDLGFSEIDDDHREMLAIMKRIEAAANAENLDLCADLLEKLVESTMAHFRREEDLLEKAGYPDVHVHALHHSELIARANEIKDICCKATKSRKKFQDLSWEMFEMFLDEVVAGDLHFKSFLQDRGIIKGS